AANPDVRTLIGHYVEMLRRHVVTESNVAEMCKRIYWKHKRALDLIFEHRPDRQGAIKDFLITLVGEENQLTLDNSSKAYIRFAPKEWDKFNCKSEKDWSAEGRLLVFEFQNSSDSLKLKLILGP